MDGLELLKQDHKRVKELMGHIEEGGDDEREALFAVLADELRIHETIEEEVLYPTLKEHPRTEEITLEAYEEHEVVNTILGEMIGLPVEDETWEAKFTVVKENLEHHIEEEESEMFEQAREVLKEAELEDLGARMEARKQELEAG
jgi:hemerythrin HHE cation binding domain-containing protein